MTSIAVCFCFCSRLCLHITLALFFGTLLEGMGYAEGQRVTLLVEQDPDIVEDALFALPKVKGLKGSSFTALGGKREIARTILAKLNEVAPSPADCFALPDDAPYGRIKIDTKGCTLCLALDEN